MFRRPAPPVQARRALIVDLEQNRRSWIGNGVAALAISVLGLGIAGSVMLNSNAASTSTGRTELARSASTEVVASQVVTTKAPGVEQPSAFLRRSSTTSRDAARPDLNQQAALGDAGAGTMSPAQSKAAANRAAALIADAKDTRTRAEQLVRRRNGVVAAAGSAVDSVAAPTGTTGGASLPVTAGFTIAARFGAVGAWARYHTGIDFSAPIGTPIHAIAAGVITHAGPGGGAGGWAGNYVTIQHADGTQTLYAHQSVVVVSVGQQVSAGQVIGHIGMTGRSFGPHVHVELYPAGVAPGDVYSAIDPAPWMRALGLNV